MDAALEALRHAICEPGRMAEIGSQELQAFAARSVVALPVGGHGSRLGSVTEPLNVQKNALRMPNGETMVELTIRMYRDAGFRDFVALVFHRAESIVDLLGDGSHLGVDVTYSHDPSIPVGRGGAIRNALDNGSIPCSRNLIVHNPDDVIVQYPGSFPRDLVAAHLAGRQQGMLATAVMVEGTHAAYTGMSVRNGVVEEVIAYPLVPIPAHIGVTLLSPAVYDYFFELFDLTKKMDFEATLFPLLATKRLLYSAIIPNECWLQVNDPKALDRLANLLRDERRLTSASTREG